MDQRWGNVQIRLRNVDKTLRYIIWTLFQNRDDIISTLLQRGLNSSSSYIEGKGTSDKHDFVNRLIRFILLNEKTFSYNVLII